MAEAGWYQDPKGDGLRWFDGSAWTEHVAAAPAGAQESAVADPGRLSHLAEGVEPSSTREFSSPAIEVVQDAAIDETVAVIPAAAFPPAEPARPVSAPVLVPATPDALMEFLTSSLLRAGSGATVDVQSPQRIAGRVVNASYAEPFEILLAEVPAGTELTGFGQGSGAGAADWALRQAVATWTNPSTFVPTAGATRHGDTARPGELAGFGARLGAFLLDGTIVVLPYWVVVNVLLMRSISAGMLVALGGLALIAWYFAQGEGGPSGQTIGKRIMGIAVVDTLTLRPGIGLGRGIGRYFARAVLNSVTCGIPLGYLWMLWDPDSQTLHDKMVRTKVVVVR